MDDVFDEDADELTVSKNEFNKIMENIEKEGYVEGIGDGKQQAVQAGFNGGYEIAFKYFYKINLLKGVVCASLNVPEKDKFDQLKAIEERLSNLEKQMMNDLVKDNKKDHSELFNVTFDQIKNQLKELNLFKDLEHFFNDE